MSTPGNRSTPDDSFIAVSNNQEVQQVNEFIKASLRLCAITALHPFEYAKVLMQIGFEPIPPRPGYTLLGQPAMVLPNIFQYTGYIRRMDGFLGLFRGLSPRLMGTVVGMVASEKIAVRFGLGEPEPKTPGGGNGDEDSDKEQEESEEEQRERFVRQLKRDLVLHTSSIIISHPFHVVSVRMMTQFVGRELKYTSIFGSLLRIWREEGLFGLFSGLIPRLLCDLSCLIVASSTTFLVNKHFIQEKEARQYFGGFNAFIWAGIFYPFSLVSTCMIVSGSGLHAGKPPQMPIYSSWQQCFSMLRAGGELKRGSSMFFRYARPYSLRFAMAPYPELSKY